MPSAREWTRYEGVYTRKKIQPGTKIPDPKNPGTFKAKEETIYYVVYRNPAGEKVEERVGTSSKKMTAARASRIRAARISGSEPSNREKSEAKRKAKKAEEGRWTFRKLWAEWMKANPQKKGRVNDNNRYMVHLNGPFGNKEPREVSPLDIRRLRVALLEGNALPPGRRLEEDAKRRSDYAQETRKKIAEEAAKKGEGRKYAVGTVISVLSLLRRIASFGVKQRLCEGIPFTVEMPKGAKQKTEDMSPEEMARYIKTCREWPDPMAGRFQLLELFTGMRRSETRFLKWSDVDQGRGFILLRDPKGGEDVRIPINDAAAELLKGIPQEENNPYVFPGEGEGPRAIRDIVESSRAIRDAAGMPKDWRPNHALRHCFASSLASSGQVDLFNIQKMLGHKSPQMTMRYSHLRDEALRRGSNVMAQIVKEAEGQGIGGASQK